MTAREPAWRVFAAELSAAGAEERGEGDRATAFLISPFGARISRVLALGIAGPAEGREGGGGALRSTLRDPTGDLVLNSAQYHPAGTTALQRLDTTSPVLVVGKAHWTRDPNGGPTPGIRVEGLRRLSAEELRAEYALTLTQTLARLQLARGHHGTTKGALPESPPPRGWQAAVLRSAERYPDAEVGPFLDLLGRVLDVMDGGDPPEPVAPSPVVPSTPRAVTVTRRPAADQARPQAAPSTADRAEESAFLDDVDALCEGSIDGYAALPELLERCAQRGVPEERAESILNRLEESGALEEPIVGRLRRA